MWPHSFLRRFPRPVRPDGLEAFFEPLSDIEFPEELLFLGSGSTPPQPEWSGIPSIRVNDKTLDLFPRQPIFGVVTQILSTPKVMRHPLFRSDDPPWIWQFMNEIKLETSRRRERERERDRDGDRGRQAEKYRLIGTKDLKDATLFRRLDSQFTTGSLVILFLLYAPVRRFYIAGYDGYRREGKYFRADGRAWHGRHHGHDLGAEWRLIERAAAMARSAGKTVEIAKLGGELTRSS
jgi:hypothetical protein